jgi:hypothetical protein
MGAGALVTRPPKSRVRPHVYRPGPADEADAKGRRACEDCHLIGEPGDQHHTLPPPVPDVASLAAGERPTPTEIEEP